MVIVVLGGTGFIGQALVQKLLQQGHQVRVSSRQTRVGSVPNLEYRQWNGQSGTELVPILQGADAVINLLGENIAAGRWTVARKLKLLHSRLQVGQAIVQAMQQMPEHPKCLLQASAVGYYGAWPELATAPLCAEERESGTGVLAEIARQWEASSLAVENLGVRRCILRTAPVLGAGGGMLQKMLPAFQYGLGGVPGSGKQPFAWIHLEDEVNAIIYLLEHEELQGAFNLAAPAVVSMADFIKTLGATLHRPIWVPMPEFILHLALGEMADELLLAGQKTAPAKLLGAGFQFKYPDLNTALQQALLVK